MKRNCTLDEPCQLALSKWYAWVRIIHERMLSVLISGDLVGTGWLTFPMCVRVSRGNLSKGVGGLQRDLLLPQFLGTNSFFPIPVFCICSVLLLYPYTCITSVLLPRMRKPDLVTVERVFTGAPTLFDGKNYTVTILPEGKRPSDRDWETIQK